MNRFCIESGRASLVESSNAQIIAIFICFSFLFYVKTRNWKQIVIELIKHTNKMKPTSICYWIAYRDTLRKSAKQRYKTDKNWIENETKIKANFLFITKLQSKVNLKGDLWLIDWKSISVRFIQK